MLLHLSQPLEHSDIASRRVSVTWTESASLSPENRLRKDRVRAAVDPRLCIEAV